MILPYHKIAKTEEDKQFFFSHKGYFNFWDEYLFMNIGHKDCFTCLVNRPKTEFHGKPTEDYKIIRDLHIKQSIYQRKPEEMFNDFPELLKIKLKEKNNDRNN